LLSHLTYFSKKDALIWQVIAMEAVGSAASVVALAVTALQSVKFIYDSIHAIKNGPEKLRKATEAVEHLQRLLEIIKATAERCKESLGQADSECVRSIEPLLEQCATDLKVFEDFLRGLKMKTGPQVTNRLSGHFATFLHSKEFKNIHDTLQHHVQLFNSCLSNAGLWVS
jgi:ABC-type multidrug transport system fused ATPase/permease subunit